MKNKCHTGWENIVRKGEIACYEQFLTFLTMFSTAIYLKCVKMQHCVVIGEQGPYISLCTNDLNHYHIISLVTLYWLKAEELILLWRYFRRFSVPTSGDL